MAHQQNPSNIQGGSEIPYAEGTELYDRIQWLETELNRLKSQSEKPSGKTDLLPSTQVNLDPVLQQQILMFTAAMPHMMWVSDSEGKTTHANNRFYEFTGMPRHSDDGWAWVNVLHPDDLKEALDRGNEAALSNSSFSMELRCKNHQGEYLWHLMHSIPFYDPSTKSTKWFGTTTDIQAQKRAQEELAESESQLSTLADAIPHIVFAANPDASVYFWNHRFFEYSGLSVEQSKTDAWMLLIHPQDRQNFVDTMSEVLVTGETLEVEFRLKRAAGVAKNQGYRWHLARAVAMRDHHGKIVRWFGTWTEIEDQKRNQETDK
ncbi:MAG: PAS domain-containing protein [Candidatus Melainabacteria bacterium]|nr:PAS domain-containing protein [Candidatus Melainabacteria bacterium]